MVGRLRPVSADILEVVYALAEDSGLDRQRLEKLRAVKVEERGAFSDRVIWCGNQPHGMDGTDGRPLRGSA